MQWLLFPSFPEQIYLDRGGPVTLSRKDFITSETSATDGSKEESKERQNSSAAVVGRSYR